MSRRDEYNPVAKEIPFDNVGKNFINDDVDSAVSELREQTIYTITTLTTTLNGFHQIGEDHSYLHVLTGTATGYSIILPDATTLPFNGRRFEFQNSSPQPIELKDYSGTTVATLIEGDIGIATLQSNATAAGIWLLKIISSSATGITSYSIGSDTIFTTSSTTDVTITGMSITPIIGRYALYFSADITISQNNRLAQGVIYVDGAVLSRTRRTVQGVSSNFQSNINLLGEITVNGSQTVDVRVNINSGSLNVNQRRLILIRLGQS